VLVHAGLFANIATGKLSVFLTLT